MLALHWEMEFRTIKEKIAFIHAIREAAMSTRDDIKPSDKAIDEYVKCVAPFVADEEERERKKIFEVLEKESQQPWRIAPIQRTISRIVPPRKKKDDKDSKR